MAIKNTPRYKEAVELVRSADKATTTLLREHFHIGQQTATVLMDAMEFNGVIKRVSRCRYEVVRSDAE